MEFNFSVMGDRIALIGRADGVTGNVNSYICKFNFLTDSALTWFCVFKQGEKVYQQVIENGECMMPKEVLEQPENIQVGCYAINGNMRISTNWEDVKIGEGAYTDAAAPQPPTQDVWETLVMNSLPYIGENGNWYVYDIIAKTYTDSGKQSQGKKGDTGAAGYTPQKGTDYWTESDKEEIKAYVEKAILGGAW